MWFWRHIGLQFLLGSYFSGQTVGSDRSLDGLECPGVLHEMRPPAVTSDPASIRFLMAQTRPFSTAASDSPTPLYLARVILRGAQGRSFNAAVQYQEGKPD